MPKLLLGAITALLTLLFLALLSTAPAGDTDTQLKIPHSLELEHAAIHVDLSEAAKVQGLVGSTAKTLAEDLKSHLDREEEIALPPLGVLASLANGIPVPDAQLAQAQTASEALRHEMPALLGEHARVLRDIEAFRTAAKNEHLAKYEELADELQRHIETEEEVLYPAAVLVGDLIKIRQKAG